MATALVDDRRLRLLNDHAPDPDGHPRAVLDAGRGAHRHQPCAGLAVQRANDLGLPLLVFGLWDQYPSATARTFQFLVEGLRDVATMLDRRRIGFVVRGGHPLEVAVAASGRAAVVVTDRGHMVTARRWRRDLGRRVDVEAVEVETNLVVPVDVVTDKRQYAARTIRPRIHEHLFDFTVELSTTSVDVA